MCMDMYIDTCLDAHRRERPCLPARMHPCLQANAQERGWIDYTIEENEVKLVLACMHARI